MSQDNINTAVLQQFISQVKAADLSNQRDVRLDITTAKNLSYTLALVMTRLSGNYEGLIAKVQSTQANAPISVEMDGGSWNQK
jgi:hypothetical protein